MKIKKPSITSVFIYSISLAIATYTFVKILSNPILLSGASQIINKLRPEAKSELITSTENLNKLIDITKKIEVTPAGKLPDEKKDVNKVAINRQKIAESYTEIADLLSKESVYFGLNDYEITSLMEEMIKGLNQAAIKSNKPGSRLSKLYPQNVNFFSLGFSEMTNSMNTESKEELLEATKQANSLIDLITINEDEAKKDISRKDYFLKESLVNREKLFKISMKMSVILSEDLQSIQINNPRIAELSKEVVSRIQKLALSFREVNSPLTKFRPQDINY